MQRMGADVQFKASLSTADNCVCSACFGSGQVLKLSLPETKYHNGYDLETQHEEYWLCEKCRDKLKEALNGKA